MQCKHQCVGFYVTVMMQNSLKNIFKIYLFINWCIYSHIDIQYLFLNLVMSKHHGWNMNVPIARHLKCTVCTRMVFNNSAAHIFAVKNSSDPVWLCAQRILEKRGTTCRSSLSQHLFCLTIKLVFVPFSFLTKSSNSHFYVKQNKMCLLFILFQYLNHIFK